jgi:hypothetical protein
MKKGIMKKAVAITIFFTSVLSVFGQEKNPASNLERNTIYAEAFGQGFCYSLNYDRLFNADKRFMNSFTAGFVYVPKSMGFGDGTYIGVPLSYNWLLGKKSHHLELGVGLTALLVNPNSNTVTDFYTYLTPKIGYRYQRPSGGLFFKATLTPMIDVMHVSTYKFEAGKTRNFSSFNNVVGLGYAAFPWPGLSIGYTFK